MQKNLKKRILSVLAVLFCLHMILNAAYLKNNFYLNIEVREGVEVSELEQAAIYAILSNLPPVLIQNYTMDGNMVYITDSVNHPDYLEYAKNQNWDAYYHFDPKETYIEIIKDDDWFYTALKFYHEFGHYLDYKTKSSSLTCDFLKIYKPESFNSRDEYINKYMWKLSNGKISLNKTNREYFANQFADIILIGAGLKEEDTFSCEKARNYIEKELFQLKIKTWLRPNYLVL